MSDNCIILMCNKLYLDKAKNTIHQLRTIGEYVDDIVLLIGDDLKNENLVIDNIIIKYFPDINRNNVLLKPISDGREFNKIFQWHKIHIFDVYFKKWKKCLYIDSGMHIFNSIQRILDLECNNILLAHSDSYPTYEWKLKNQFDFKQYPDLFTNLYSNYDLERDYFQSGILLYDTNLIDYDTKDNLLQLSNKYINSKTNEQGIMNIYFNCIKNVWRPIRIKDDDIYYYDYWERDNLKFSNYIMLKYPKTIKINEIRRT